ncbi:ribonuclease P protein subunit p25-like protein [Synchiropus picturatus]
MFSGFMADKGKHREAPTFFLVSSTEDSSSDPFPGLSTDVLHMRVKEGSKIRNFLSFASAQMEGDGCGETGASAVPAIWILVSKDPLDPSELGYQPPLSTTEEEVERGDAESPSQETPAKRLCVDALAP